MAARTPSIPGPSALRDRISGSGFSIGVVAVSGAAIIGLLLAARLKLGVGLLIAMCYGPLVLIDLPIGLAIWVGLVLVQHLAIVSVAPNAAGILVAAGWFAALRTRSDVIKSSLQGHGPLLVAGALLFVWCALSPAWATDSSQTYDDIGLLGMAILAGLVVATTVTTRSQVTLLLAAFVIGSTVAVLAGVLEGGFDTSGTAIQSAASKDGRFAGAGGDPNYLAAGLIPAIAVAATLIGQVGGPVRRVGLAGMIVVMGFGLAASQSRGGLIAAVLAAIAALVLYRRRFLAVLVVGAVVVVGASFFAVQPAALQRVTQLDGGGTGRSDLWRVGWLIFKDHPVTGVGLDNFRSESFRYVRKPGNLEYVRLIAERPVVVHNTYLELLVEVGVVGLVLFLAVVGLCLRASFAAAARFSALGQAGMAQTARSVVVATIGMLAACFFLSIAGDLRLWVLLGLGPALLGVARRASGPTIV